MNICNACQVRCLMSWRAAIMASLAVTMVGCSSGGSSAGGPAAGGGGAKADASAKIACAHFRIAVEDEQAGTLTDQEFRARIKAVYDTGRVSATPGVAEGSRQVLAAVTAGDTAGLPSALDSLDSACVRVGQ